VPRHACKSRTSREPGQGFHISPDYRRTRPELGFSGGVSVMKRVQRVIGDIIMLSWFAIPFHAARLGMEAQNAMALSFLSLVGSAPNAAPGKMISDKTTVAPEVQAAPAKVAPSSARIRAAGNKAPKKRKRLLKRRGSR
jgi:hypothetical protein